MVESLIDDCFIQLGLIIIVCVSHKRNQNCHVKMNLVHKLYRLQSIAAQPLHYFEKLISKDELIDAEKKLKSKPYTWYTLTIDGLIGVLYQVKFLRILELKVK